MTKKSIIFNLRKLQANSSCSFRDQYGISSEVKQSLVLQESVKINNRFFNTDGM